VRSASLAEKPKGRWHRKRKLSPATLTFSPMLFLPHSEEIRPFRQAAPHPLDGFFGDRLEHDPSKLIFKEPDLGSGLDAVLAPELCRHYKLSF
jgi:hypothetical protein